MTQEFDNAANYYAGKGPEYAALNATILRPTERLELPAPEQMVVYAREGIIRRFGRDFEIPNPPDDLYEDVERFSALGIERLRIYYQPHFQFDPEVELDPSYESTLPVWQEGRGVKLNNTYWQWMKDGRLPIAPWREGWVISDRRTKPSYDNGQQRYEDDEFMEQKVMLALKNAKGGDGIEKYQYVPDYSRAGASPEEIEGKIIPYFVKLTRARGIVEMPTVLERNIEANDEDPASGKTNTSEWFADKLLIGKMVNGKFVEDTSRRPSCLVGGRSDYGGLAHVVDWPSDGRGGSIAFRLQVRYPSQKAA